MSTFVTLRKWQDQQAFQRMDKRLEKGLDAERSISLPALVFLSLAVVCLISLFVSLTYGHLTGTDTSIVCYWLLGILAYSVAMGTWLVE